jgi:cysteine-rich repeat protein
VVKTAVAVDPGTVIDLGARAFEIRSPGAVTVTGGDFVLAARSVRVGNGARLVGLPDGTSPATIILMTVDDVEVDPTGRITLSSETVPGRLEIYAAAIRVDGTLHARGIGGSVDGGVLLLRAEASIALNGPVSVEGDGEGWGGWITARAGRDLAVTGSVDATGANGGTIELTSMAGTVRLVGGTDLSAHIPYGDAGSLDVTAPGAIVLGDVKGRGAGNPVDGGGLGAAIDVESNTAVTLSGPIAIDGAAPDGTGGSLEVTAGTTFTQTAAVSAAGNGADGCGGSISITAAGNATTNGLSVVGGRCGGGSVDVLAGGQLTVTGEITADGTGNYGGGTATVEAPRVQVASSIHASGVSTGPGGTVWVTACEPTLLDTSELAARGANGRTVIWSSGQATVAGDLFAGVANEIVLRNASVPPLFLPGATSSPKVTTRVDPTLDPCGGPAVCGNGTIEAGEECDDGGTSACDGCSSTCRQEGCGNGVTECGEQCDDGGTTACDGCSSTCRQERCGDGVSECAEECDAGAANGTPGGGCSAACTLPPPALRIPGGGAAATDCAFQWSFAHAQPGLDGKGRLRTMQVCVDGDPGCDFDPTPGNCRFRVWPCAGAGDPAAGCPASTVTRLELRKPTAQYKPPSGPLRLPLLAGLATVPIPAGPGETCGAPIDLDVPVGKRRASIQVRAYRGNLVSDTDALKLACHAVVPPTLPSAE